MKPGPYGMSRAPQARPEVPTMDGVLAICEMRQMLDNPSDPSNQRLNELLTELAPLAKEPRPRKSRSDNPLSFAWADLPGLEND